MYLKFYIKKILAASDFDLASGAGLICGLAFPGATDGACIASSSRELHAIQRVSGVVFHLVDKASLGVKGTGHPHGAFFCKVVHLN